MDNQDFTNQIAASLGVTQQPEVQATPAPESAPETITSEPSTSTQEPEVQPDNSPAPEANQNNQDNSTIRQMREQLSQSKKEAQKQKELLERIAREQGISVEQLEESITAKENKRRGEQLGVSPEVAAQLAAQEARIRELEEQNTRIDFNNRVNNFQSEFRLSPEETMTFLQDAQAQGFDVLRPGTNLSTLYRAINFERLSKAKEAEIRQQILNDMQRQRENANQVPGTTPVPASPNAQDDMSDKDFKASLFNSLKK